MKTMTHKNLVIAVIGLICSIALSCSSPTLLSGQTITVTRDLPEFNSITLAFSGDVYVSQGDRQKVEIEADQDAMDRIETEVRGGSLVLKTKNGFWNRIGQVKVYITIPEISGIQVSGSGDVLAQTPISADRIELKVSGSGSINIDDLESYNIEASITGSGDIGLSGSPTEGELQAVITGSGSYRGEDLEVATANVNITGSGSARITVSDELITRITGSGNVMYKGSPLINSNSTGSGRTRSIN